MQSVEERELVVLSVEERELVVLSVEERELAAFLQEDVTGFTISKERNIWLPQSRTYEQHQG